VSAGTSQTHDSAALHVSGRAQYCDDIPLPANTLHAAFGLSSVAHGRIIALDLSAVATAPGVVAIALPADIPGENNYGGAVKRLNAIRTQLDQLDFGIAPNFVVNGLKREELIAYNSTVLHEVYFDSLGGSGRPRDRLLESLEHDFQGFSRWQTEFTAMGKALGGGGGSEGMGLRHGVLMQRKRSDRSTGVRY